MPKTKKTTTKKAKGIKIKATKRETKKVAKVKEKPVKKAPAKKVEEIKVVEEAIPAPKTEEVVKEEIKKIKPLNKNFISASGRRKTATARVFLWEEKGDFTVNGLDIYKYFPSQIDQLKWVRPFHAIGVSHPDSKYSASIKVKGSGKPSQMDAIVLAFARVLEKIDQEYGKTLRKLGFMTRDPRMVERKKYYLHKARKRPQYSKR